MSFDSSLSYYLEPIRDLLETPDITEICICGEHKVFYEAGNEWTLRHVDSFYFDQLRNIADIIASDSGQNISEERPILSAQLSSGERIQISIPPASIDISITIRKPSTLIFSLDDFDEMGSFKQATVSNEHAVSSVDYQLLDYLANQQYKDFLSLAVKSRKNIVVSGATGSGKTTFMKGLILEIPKHERIITIEDVPELILPHENCVRLTYSKDAKSKSDVTPKMLLESCLRMRPDRILLAELRGEEAFYYVRNVNSGHPGSITSVHANSPKMAFDQLMLYIKESEAGKNLERQDIITLLHMLIDIVVQFVRDENGQRVISEIYFDPAGKNALLNV